ncbi:PD-(D/E)XK nuclease family protein [Leadbetterella sp. DM7]|uniref:PD-(D/E)XK nuclease family protein n=1 Tax=Leadbetterella sp. DM7 TaxID=3235085 RepID=UPI00349E7B4C
MNSFLGRAAAYIFEKHGLNALQELKIVLPSRRAALYFRNELAGLSSIPFFSPEISSIDDFIQGLSGLKPIDPIDLYFESYEQWKVLDPGQSFEKFLSWAPTLIRDFDLIDSALLPDPHELFRYMSEAEALKRWDLEEHEFSAVSSEYFTFFDKMAAVYDRLNEILPEKGLSYTGMAYREATRHIPESGFFYFIGLNALSRAEERIITTLIRAKRAECIWDSDDFYMNSRDKAGKKLRSYKKSGRYGAEWNFQGNLLQESAREVHVYELSAKTLQARLATDLAARSSAQSHALVVLDESDFPALFIQVPALDFKVNISGGAALKGSMLMPALEILLRVMDTEGENLRLDLVRALMGNELLKSVMIREAGERQVAQWEKQLARSTHLYMARKNLQLKGSGLFEAIALIREPLSFLAAAERFLAALAGSKSEESPFAVTLLQKLEILKSRAVKGLSAASFRILFNEVAKNLSLPFEKQPDARLQVMSMLETRCLDFEEITFLSFSEGNLPSGKKNNSFIPYDAHVYFDLPSYSDQDAIMAYHFFRLLQRARKVNILYPLDTGTGVGRKERSRFLYQLEEELLPLNDKMRFFYPEVAVLPAGSMPPQAFQVEKTPEILQKVRHFLSQRGLSATSLNEYFVNELSFYWKYIERIRRREQDDAAIGYNVFGSIVHYVLEKTDESYVGALITREVLENQKQYALASFDALVAESQPDFDFKYGLNAVLKTLAAELVGKYFDKRLREFTGPFYIEGLEKKFQTTLEIDGTPVRLEGTVDKIERHGDRLVVIDYKTGDVDPAKIKYPPYKKEYSLEEYLALPELDKFRQLLLYKFLISEVYGKNAKYEIKFYSFRRLDSNLILEVENHTNEEILEAVQHLVVRVVSDLLDAGKPFAADPEKKVPPYSDFAGLLGSS